MLSPGHHLIAYEFREGPPMNTSDLNPDFFCEIITYLLENKLEKVLGLQVIQGQKFEEMVEFVLKGSGTVMLYSSEVTYRRPYKVTKWRVDRNNSIVEFNGGESHALLQRELIKSLRVANLLQTSRD